MATTTTSPSTRIVEEATSWPGVEAGPGRRGELAIRFGRRELGHLHGDRSAHFSFPKDVWAELFAAGRIVHHPVFPGKEGPAARAIASEDDIRDVIALLRLNYERAANGPAPKGLVASAPHALPFAPNLEIRSFVLERERGNILVYGAPATPPRQVERWYLNHVHEGMFPPDQPPAAPLFVHAADAVDGARATFTRRHTLDDDFEVIPTPGHTPGATAYLWDSGEHRFLFTGDTVYLDDGQWIAAMLESSDRAAYVDSLELLKTLDFDVLVPWAATRGRPYLANTNRKTPGSASTGSSSACATAARASPRAQRGASANIDTTA
ncbi:MAG TPA: luciferase family protein [Solirubrobacteraceae bacterium]|nr:luciferase family protein [Solirubrobacteraceae bacterium]